MFSLVRRGPVQTWWPALLTVALIVLAGGVLVATAPEALATQSPTSCANTIGLVDGGFENPVIGANSFAFFPQGFVPGWSTTATDSIIEIWHNNWFGVTAAAGDQHAELNATQASTLYQDLTTIPGTVMRWSLAHRGREGADTMAVQIGPAGGTLVQQRVITDGTSAWGNYSGFYTVPAGQTTTRFAFAAVSTFGGNLSVGNFVDDISFGTDACVVATQAVSPSVGGVYGQAGDVLTVTVGVDSDGGNPATGSIVRSSLPPGVSFVPGSLRVTTGSVTTSPSDGAGDDVGEYDPSTGQVVVRVGTGATATSGGRLGGDESSTVTYQVRVDPASAPRTVDSFSTVTFDDPLTNTSKTATTNSVSMTLNPIADLAVMLARTSGGPVVAGSSVTYVATLTNTGGTSTVVGQDWAYTSRLTSQLPASLTGARATTPGGTCSVSGSTLTCDVGTLTRNEQRTVTVTATVSPGTPPVAGGLILGVTASTRSRDFNPANDQASVTDDVTAVADVGVTLTATPSTPPAGTDVTYAAAVTNSGPSTARSVVLTEPVPTGLSNPRASVAGGTCSVGPDSSSSLPNRTDVVTCSVPELAPGVPAVVTIVFRAVPDATGTVQNSVSVRALTPDPANANNTASLVTPLTVVADVRAVLTVPAGNVPLGGSTPAQLTITNDGPSTAVNTRLDFTAPAGFSVVPSATPYCSASGCSIPTLAPGASVVLNGTFLVTASTAPGRATVTATATPATYDPNTGNNTGTAVVYVGAPSLQVSVIGAITDTRRTRGADVGDRVVWTVVITNAGDVDVTNPVVVLPGTTTAVATTCGVAGGTLSRGATAACRLASPQTVTSADVRALAVTTTVQVTASWVGGTEVRSPSAGGSLATVLPPAIVVPSSQPMLGALSTATAAASTPYLSATSPPQLQLASDSSDTVAAPAPANGASWQLSVLAGAVMLAPAGATVAVRRLRSS